MKDVMELNVPLLRKRVANLTAAAKSAGLRAATVSDLTTGKIPIGRAEVRTLVALAELSGCTLDELVLRGTGAGIVETGIKVIDLFAPLPRGGSAGLLAELRGVGVLVSLAEMLRSLAFRRGFSCVVWLPDAGRQALDEQISTADASFREMVEPAAEFMEGMSEVADFATATRSTRDVLIVADQGRVLSGELLQLRDELAEAGSRPITYLLYDPTGDGAQDDGAPFGPLEAAWRFDGGLAARGVWPAIDPVFSVSSLIESEQLEASHLAVAREARRVLRRYRELRPGVERRGLEKYPPESQQAYRRGERLEAFMTQPYGVAQPFTNRPGVFVPLQETLAGVRRILAGDADALAIDDLKWLGQLPSSVA